MTRARQRAGARSFDTCAVAGLLQVARDASVGGAFDERMEAITSTLRRLIPTPALSLIIVDPGVHGGVGRAFFRGLDPADVQAYPEHYLASDPGPRHAMAHPGEVRRLSDLLPSSRFGHDPYTGELLHRLSFRHVMGFMLPTPDGRWLTFGMHRERGVADFSLREREVLQLVGPDLARAAFSSLLREKVTGSESAGAVVFDGDADVIHAGAHALHLARLVAPAGFPPPPLVVDVKQLARPGAAVGDARERLLVGPGGETVRARCTVLDVSPTIRVLATLERVSARKVALLGVLRRAGLTRREEQVAALAAEGLSNRGIADQLRLSPATVNVHLGRVFRKTGLDRTGLIRALAGPA